MLHGVTVRSPSPRGRIRDIRLRPGHPLGRDSRRHRRATSPAPTASRSSSTISRTSPPSVVNHAEEPVAAARAPRPRCCSRRRGGSVTIEIEPLPPVFTIDEALAAARDHLGRRQRLQVATSSSRGDVDAALAAARHRSSRASTRPARRSSSTSSRTGCSRCAVAGDATASPSGARCSARTTSTRRSPALFNLPAEKIRVVQMETGGGFGGKEEYPSIIAGHAALLAWKSGGR